MGEGLTAPRPLPENDLKTIWSQSHEPFLSLTILVSEMHQSLVCLTRYYRLYCVTISPFMQSWFCFRWLLDKAPHDSFTHCRDSCLRNSSYYTPEFLPVFKLTKLFDIHRFYYPAWWLYPATSFVVSASKPFIHQIVGTNNVIEVFSTITYSGGAVEKQTPSGLLNQTVESTFSGESADLRWTIEDMGSRGVQLELETT